MEKSRKPKIRFKGYNDDWEQRELGEYVSITSGEAPSKFEEGTELYVKVDDLNYNDKYVFDTQNKVCKHSTAKRVTKGSIIFPKRGAAIMTNKVRIIGIDSYMDTNMMALTSEKLDSEFLYNIISKEGLYKIADTSTIPQINNKHVEPYEVTISSLDEQRRIGAYFKQLDILITLHQRKLDKLINVKKSMLEKMFPKQGSTVPEVRFSGFTEDWEQREFDEVFVEKRDKTERENEDTLLSCAINGIYLNSELFGHFRGATTIGYLKVNKNDLILSAQNLHLGNANVNLRFEHGIISPAYKVYNLADCDPYFVHSWVKKDSTKNFFLRATTEGASQCRKNIEWHTLEKQTILMPVIREQNMIGNYFKALDDLITLHQRKLEKLKNIKKSMLEKMFI